MKGRVVIGGIVKGMGGGYVFKIRAGCDEDINRVKDLIVSNLVLNGVVCTVDMGFYDLNREVDVVVSD